MIALTQLLKGIKSNNKTVVKFSENYHKFNSKFLIKINLKHFTEYFQNENFKSSKSSSSQSIEDIMGNSNSQDSNYRNPMNNNMQGYQNQFSQAPKKRNRMSFLRDGMIISFYLRKVLYLSNDILILNLKYYRMSIL
jgi:hypothetical protein